MNTEEVAKKVVELTRKQAWKEAIESLYSKDMVSVEARAMEGGSPESRGSPRRVSAAGRVKGLIRGNPFPHDS